MKILTIMIVLTLTSNLFCEEKSAMKRYIQPFGNRQLNSLLTLECKAKGKLGLRYKHTQDNFKAHNRVNSLFIIKENIVFLDAGWCGRLVDLNRQEEIGMQKKSENDFIVLEEKGENFYFINSGILTIKNTGNFTLKTKEFFVTILGERVSQVLFYPEQETYIAASNYPPSPRTDSQFCILKSNYEKQETIWEHRFKKEEVPMCPVSRSGQVLAGLKNKIIAINNEGKITTIFEGDFTPVALSIGYDNTIYSLLVKNEKIVLKALSFCGKELFENETEFKWSYRIHPPLVSLASIVYVISGEKLEAFSKDGKLWEYPLANADYSQLATLLEDETILLCTGNKIIHLDEFGKELWVYTDEKKLPFLTQPVIDHKGRVMAATNEDIVILE